MEDFESKKPKLAKQIIAGNLRQGRERDRDRDMNGGSNEMTQYYTREQVWTASEQSSIRNYLMRSYPNLACIS